MRCRNCKYFERGKWHKSICPDESDQLGGQCKVLPKLLGMTNFELYMCKSLHVYESFGCSAGRPILGDIK